MGFWGCFLGSLGYKSLKLEAWILLRGYGLLLWKLIPLTIFWSICKKIIGRIFSKTDSSMRYIFGGGFVESKWAIGRKEFENFNLDNILINWEACMSQGFSISNKILIWSPP